MARPKRSRASERSSVQGKRVTDVAETDERDLLYREYVRLAEAGNAYVRDALSDVRLLGGVGAVLAWDPLARYLDLDAKLEQPVTPIGFTTLFLVMLHAQAVWHITRALKRA